MNREARQKVELCRLLSQKMNLKKRTTLETWVFIKKAVSVKWIIIFCKIKTKICLIAFNTPLIWNRLVNNNHWIRLRSQFRRSLPLNKTNWIAKIWLEITNSENYSRLALIFLNWKKTQLSMTILDLKTRQMQIRSHIITSLKNSLQSNCVHNSI